MTPGAAQTPIAVAANNAAMGLLPVAACALLFLAHYGLGLRPVWLADLTALLAAYCTTMLILGASRHPAISSRAALRWLPLLLATSVGVLVAVLLQARLWSPVRLAHPSWLIPGVTLGFLLASFLPGVLRAEFARREQNAAAAEALRQRAERQMLEARLAALQGQIEPHFLYNTLANVRALVRSDAAAGEAMLNHLIAYLRAAMPDLRAATTTLGQELDRTAAYLEIMRIRLGERLSFTIDAAPQARACAIAPLSVMTLVENAIKHGIESRPQGGTVTISARRNDDALIIEVIDDGSGFKSESGEGVGLINLQARLCALFGAGAQLSVQANTPSGVVARIYLPLCIEGDPA